MIHPIILCGGSGTRLWPASRAAYPKQFAPLLGPESLYQTTLRRLSAEGYGAPFVVTADTFRFMATGQAAALGLDDARVVIEPRGRDTAPAILAAALMQDDPDALMLVAPSDHLIADAAAFRAAVETGAETARAGTPVTFGVAPDRAETGYGYLELAEPARGAGPQPLQSFREKPDRARAEEMVESGRFLWNAGIFLFRARDLIAAVEAHAPDLMAPVRAAIDEGAEDLGFFRLGRSYEKARAISIDYAVMERLTELAVVPLSCGWSDLGSWEALWQAETKDATGTATRGAVTAIDCRDSYLRSEEEGMRLVGLGLDGMVAVAMRDAVLVAPRARAQEVKSLVAALSDSGVAQARDYPRFHRPWGWYETLGAGSRFQVKRIMVTPGAALSLQSHMHRSEHWVVVAGTARIRVGETDRLLSENESVYIPLGATHRLANPGRVPMYLIEVQTGIYLGEDDIVRTEDVYGRS